VKKSSWARYLKAGRCNRNGYDFILSETRCKEAARLLNILKASSEEEPTLPNPTLARKLPYGCFYWAEPPHDHDEKEPHRLGFNLGKFAVNNEATDQALQICETRKKYSSFTVEDCASHAPRCYVEDGVCAGRLVGQIRTTTSTDQEQPDSSIRAGHPSWACVVAAGVVAAMPAAVAW
jgi:hypothetical protein